MAFPFPSLTTTLPQQDQQAPSHSRLGASTPFCNAPSGAGGVGRRSQSVIPCLLAASKLEGDYVPPLKHFKCFPKCINRFCGGGELFFLPWLATSFWSQSPARHRPPPFCERSDLFSSTLNMEPEGWGHGRAGSRTPAAPGHDPAPQWRRRSSPAAPAWPDGAGWGGPHYGQLQGRHLGAAPRSLCTTLSHNRNQTTGFYILPKTPNAPFSLPVPLLEEEEKKAASTRMWFP